MRLGRGRSSLCGKSALLLDETLCQPFSLKALSDYFAYMAQNISNMMCALHYHSGEPEEETEDTVSDA